MVAILIHRICNDIRMKRHKDTNGNSSEDEAIIQVVRRPSPREDVRGKGPSPQQPPAVEEEDSRDPHAVAPSSTTAAPSSTTTTVIATMSDLTYNKTPSFEQRDEQRSAFSPVQQSGEGVVPEETKQDHRPSSCPMPHRVGTIQEQEPLPFQSPLRYYQEEEEQHQHQHTAEAEGEAAEADAAAYPYHHYHQGYQYHQNPSYDYSRYYGQPHNSNHDRGTSPMSGSPYHHSPYPTYHPHPDYTNYPHGYGHPYSYYPSPATAAGHQHHPSPAYSATMQYPHQSHHPHHYYPGATPPPSQPPDHVTLKETPSAVTESTKGTTPSTMAHRAGGGGDGLELSPSQQSLEDGRKPSASTGPVKGILKKDSPPKGGGDHIDYEPIPLNEISAIPSLSSSAAAPDTMPPPSPTYAAASGPPHDNAFHDAFPRRRGPTPPSYAADPRLPPPAATAAAAADPSVRVVAPPIPHPSTPATTRRRQPQRTLAPSSSGSTASGSVGGGEGGSWERRYSELLEFKRAHSHCEVPQNYAENTSLGTWVNKQRMEQKNRIEGKNSSLNDSRLERLERIGFRWAKRKGQASWDEKFNELVAYKAKFGNCHVPTKYKANTALGRWVSTQRAEYKKYQEGQGKTSMNSDKMRRLEGIGFAWFMAL